MADENGNQTGSNQKTHRRQFLTLAGTAGAIGVAGCLGGSGGTGGNGTSGGGSGGTGGNGTGGDGSDENATLTMVTTQSDTSAFATSQAVAQAVNQNSDILTIEASPTGGAAQGMVQMDKGNADIAYTNVLSAIKILNEEGAYADNPFQHEIAQLFKYYEVQYGWVTSDQFWNKGLRTVTDLPGHPVSPKGAGTASREVLFAHLSEAINTNELGNLLSLPGSEDAAALSEGRAHAINDLRLNTNVAPSYVQQMYSTIDNIYQLGWPEDVVNKIRNNGRLQGSVLTDDDVDPAPTAVGPGVPWWPTATYMLFTNDRMNVDVANEFVSTVHNNVDAISQAASLASDWKEPSFFTDVSEELPVHPGAQNYFNTLTSDESPEGTTSPN